MKLQTKYHRRPSTFRQEIFYKVVPCISLCKTSDPWVGVYFRLQGYNLNNIDKVPQYEATYQIPKAWVSSFRQEAF